MHIDNVLGIADYITAGDKYSEGRMSFCDGRTDRK